MFERRYLRTRAPSQGKRPFFLSEARSGPCVNGDRFSDTVDIIIRKVSYIPTCLGIVHKKRSELLSLNFKDLEEENNMCHVLGVNDLFFESGTKSRSKISLVVNLS